MIDLHEVAAEYVASPVAAPTPTSVILARGRRLRARRRRRVVATGVLVLLVPVVTLATVHTRSSGSRVNVIAPPPTCEPSHTDCTPEQVLAAVRRIYETAGATAAESACLAPISATGKHSLLEAFAAFSDAQTNQAIRCVGSEARLQTIIDGLIAKFPGQTSSPPSDTSPGRDLGVIHTRVGDAHAYCGGNYTPSCDAPNESAANGREVALLFPICTAPIQNYLDTISKPGHSNMDLVVHELVGSAPPGGGLWDEVACIRAPTSKP